MTGFDAAYKAHTAGRLAEAEQGYRAVLQTQPSHTDAWHLLGVVAQQQGRAAEAVAHIQKALALGGPNAAYLVNLGIALASMGRSADAVATLEDAAAREPTFAAYFALGNALRSLGRQEDALTHYQHALALQPNNASAHNNIGNAYQTIGRLAEAAASYRRATEYQPTHARAHYNLGIVLKDDRQPTDAITSLCRALELAPQLVEAHIALGSLYKQEGQLPQAVEHLRAAAALKPDDTALCTNLGGALVEAGQPAEAERYLRHATALKPDAAEAFHNLGNALKVQNKLAEAAEAYDAAIGLNKDFVASRINLGVVLQKLGDFARALHVYEDAAKVHASAAAESGKGVVLHTLGRDEEALASFRRAIVIDSNFAEAHHNAGLTLLANGAFREGWDAYEWRWRTDAAGSGWRDFPTPQWQGEPGGSVLVWGEQGLGERLLYASMIPDLLARGHGVVMETDARLVTLLERSFPGVMAVARQNPPHPMTQRADIKWQSPLGSLGRWLRPDRNSFPADRATLVVDDGRKRAYRRHLEAAGAGPMIGISWISSNPNIGRHKTLALEQWAPILQIPGVRFVDLQYGNTSAEREAIEAALGVHIQHIPDLNLREDIDGVAALAAACDIVISVSNTTAHLAAAVGTPTWVLVPAFTGTLWYWMREGTQTPWYPIVSIFRQARQGEWCDVLGNIAARLKEAAAV